MSHLANPAPLLLPESQTPFGQIFLLHLSSIAYVWNFETNLYFPKKIYKKTFSCSFSGLYPPPGVYILVIGVILGPWPKSQLKNKTKNIQGGG